MVSLYSLLRPLLFTLPPEFAHTLTLRALKTGLLSRFIKPFSDPALRVTLWGMEFPNPVGLAAGFDKDGQVTSQILELGFGFVEAGTVTPRPQIGNPKPRVFRFPAHEAIINAMGFPGIGMHKVKTNLTAGLERERRPAGFVGINIGMNKNQKKPEDDYNALIKLLAPMADYLAVNISSPNTPGLRNLQKPENLTALLGALKATLSKTCGRHPPPLLVKLAPDLSEEEQKEIAAALLQVGIDGMILTNTTTQRDDNMPDDMRYETGGLSGVPLRSASTQVIRSMYTLTKGKIPIIGVGGVSDAHSAYEKIRAGASLVQLYSGFVYKGPDIANQINRELLEYIKKDGYSSIAEAVGADAKPL